MYGFFSTFTQVSQAHIPPSENFASFLCYFLLSDSYRKGVIGIFVPDLFLLRVLKIIIIYKGYA